MAEIMPKSGPNLAKSRHCQSLMYITRSNCLDHTLGNWTNRCYIYCLESMKTMIRQLFILVFIIQALSFTPPTSFAAQPPQAPKNNPQQPTRPVPTPAASALPAESRFFLNIPGPLGTTRHYLDIPSQLGGFTRGKKEVFGPHTRVDLFRGIQPLQFLRIEKMRDGNGGRDAIFQVTGLCGHLPAAAPALTETRGILAVIYVNKTTGRITITDGQAIYGSSTARANTRIYIQRFQMNGGTLLPILLGR